jgi:hypothetical protein
MVATLAGVKPGQYIGGDNGDRSGLRMAATPASADSLAATGGPATGDVF